MATISEISQASSYRGTPELGGSLGTAITIDSSPLQRFATFIYYRDQNLWNQKLKDDANAAKQIADMSAYDITSPLKPYSDDLKTELSDLQKFVRENPDALLYSRNPKKYQELQERLGRFENKRAKATTNDALYNAAKSKAEQIVDPEERELELRKVDAKVDRLFLGGLETAYNQQFESIPALKPSDYKIPTAALTQRTIILPGDNKDYVTELTYTDVDDAYAKAAITVAGAQDEDIRKYDWFKKLSPNEQQIALDESKITSKTRRMLQGISVEFTAALKEWQAANQGVNINSIADISVLPDGTLENNVRSIKAINDGIEELNALVLAGQIADPSGRVRTIPYSKIKFEDGLSEEELIVVKSLQESKTPLISKIEKKIVETDDAIQRANLSTEWARIGLSKRQLDRADSEDLIGAQSVLNEAMAILSKGVKINVDNSGAKGEKQQLLEIADPTLLKGFGDVDKDGKVTNVPDVVQYDTDSDQLYLVYFEKSGKEIKRTQSGGRIQKDRKPLDSRTWLKHITKRSFPNKDIGGVNTIIEDVLTKNGGNLYKITQKAMGVQSTSVNDNVYSTDTDVNNWKNNGDGTYTYIPTGQKIDSKTGKIVQ